jgi:hypothetical protein
MVSAPRSGGSASAGSAAPIMSAKAPPQRSSNGPAVASPSLRAPPDGRGRSTCANPKALATSRARILHDIARRAIGWCSSIATEPKRVSSVTGILPMLTSRLRKAPPL